MDPCTALQTSFELTDGARTQWVLLGEAGTAADSRRPDSARPQRPTTESSAAGPREKYWDDTQGTIQVRTPDARWTSCSTAGCSTRRCLPRVGPVGVLPGRRAFGFRDQLQDVMALVTAAARARARAPAARRGAAVHRRRRAALVASAVRTRRAHAHLRRSALAALRRRPLPRQSPATRRARRARPFLEGPALAARTSGRLLPARRSARARHRFRALRRARSTGASPSAPTGCR